MSNTGTGTPPGEFTRKLTTDLDRMHAVIRVLDSRGICSNLEYPGYIDLPLPDGRSLCVGIDGEEWQANISNGDAVSLCIEPVRAFGATHSPDLVALGVITAMIRCIAEVRKGQTRE